MAEEQKQELKYFVRIANTDLDGNKQIGNSLIKIKGINFMISNAICNAAGIQKTKKTGYLSDDNVDRHLLSTNLSFTQDNDIKMMKKIKSYKGVRHSLGLPVRGQRTRSNFRRNKGKVMGVKRKSAEGNK